MTIRTIRYDDAEWQVVPRKLTKPMDDATRYVETAEEAWAAQLRVAPEPPAQQPLTDEEAEALIPPVLRGVPAGNLPHVSTGYLIAMMRAVERHHGIGKGESNAD